MNFNEGMKSTGNIVQATPQNFFNWLNSIFRFDLDVCALPENAKCEKYYTPEDDGLSQKWSGGGYGAILRMEGKSSTGSRKPQRRFRKTTASLLSCSYRHEQTQNGFNSMCTEKLFCTLWKDGFHSVIRKTEHPFRACWQFT